MLYDMKHFLKLCEDVYTLDKHFFKNFTNILFETREQFSDVTCIFFEWYETFFSTYTWIFLFKLYNIFYVTEIYEMCEHVFSFTYFFQ